jgi:hypothetical protein
MREVVDGLCCTERLSHGGIAGDQRPQPRAFDDQRTRQRPNNIRQSAGLHQGIDFRCYGEDVHVAHVPRRLIISCVIRQTS